MFKERMKIFMSKTIIHSKIPTDDRGNSLIPMAQIARCIDNMRSVLGNDYVIIATPFDTNKIDGDTILINIDCKEYSCNELMEIIEKAKMYDGLCK